MAKRPKELLLAIGRRIRKIRESKGWTQSDLAERLGLSDYRLVSQFENGRRDIRVSTVARLSSALGTVPADLFPDASASGRGGIDEDLALLVREVSRYGTRERGRVRRVLRALVEGREG